MRKWKNQYKGSGQMTLGRSFIFKHVDMGVFEQYFDKMVEGSFWKSILLKESMSSKPLEVA